MHYVSKHKMVNTLSRFEKAMAKANKIQNLPCDLSTKTQLVNRSVLPMALHGAEATHIGKQATCQIAYGCLEMSYRGMEASITMVGVWCLFV